MGCLLIFSNLKWCNLSRQLCHSRLAVWRGNIVGVSHSRGKWTLFGSRLSFANSFQLPCLRLLSAPRSRRCGSRHTFQGSLSHQFSRRSYLFLRQQHCRLSFLVLLGGELGISQSKRELTLLKSKPTFIPSLHLWLQPLQKNSASGFLGISRSKFESLGITIRQQLGIHKRYSLAAPRDIL